MNAHKIYLFFVLLILSPCTLLAQNASELLSKAAQVYEQSNGISATFTFHTRMDGMGAESFEGLIEMKGDRFVLKTPDMEIWYDGSTQWVYVERNDEVNITNPTGEELESTNPMILLRTYNKEYNAKLKGESTAASGKMAYDIELTPKRKKDIERIELQLEKNSQLPFRIAVYAKNGMYTMIQIVKMETGKNQPDSYFVFNEKAYPDVEVIDLR
jgi:outer membrane lipoprotein-sorting protein